MKRSLFAPIAVLAAALVTLPAGCSQKETLNPVHGKVIYEGMPLAGALVSFHPEDDKQEPATGFTKEDGTFSVVTGDVEGAREGTYRITVMCQVPVKVKKEGMSFGGTEETEDRLKGAYANRGKSPFTVAIKDGPNQLEPFDLK
jgi:hypothetical protein